MGGRRLVLTSCVLLGPHVSPQRVEELEKENALLKSEKEEMNHRILQLTKSSGGETQGHHLSVSLSGLHSHMTY